jgi:hypothetical protein
VKLATEVGRDKQSARIGVYTHEITAADLMETAHNTGLLSLPAFAHYPVCGRGKAQHLVGIV